MRILIDANVFLYAAGAEHPSREPSLTFLERVARGEVEAVVDAEVLQEILHRSRALDRWSQGRMLYDRVRTIVPVVVPITAATVDRARSLLDDHRGLMARDALHAAVALESTGGVICSFDTDFDPIAGMRRVTPMFA